MNEEAYYKAKPRSDEASIYKSKNIEVRGENLRKYHLWSKVSVSMYHKLIKAE